MPLLYSTEISEHVRMKGTLVTGQSLLLKGSFSGSLLSSSHVTIDSGAVADHCLLEAASIAIAGRFLGTIRASVSVFIRGKADVNAEIETPSMGMADTSHFTGRIIMPDNGD